MDAPPAAAGRSHRFRTISGVALDLLLWLALSAGVLLWWSVEARRSSPLWLLLLPVLAVIVVLRRRWPVAAVILATMAGMSGLLHPESPASPMIFAVVAVSYRLGHRVPEARPALLAFAAGTGLGVVLAVLLDSGVVEWFYIAAVLPVAQLLPWLVGRYRSARRLLLHGGWERARALERQQEILIEQARLRERNRVAADMHDSLGHSLSLIALRAGALEVAPDLPAEHQDAATALRVAASTAIGHLRDTISVLSEDPYGVARVSYASVESLVAQARESGMEVRLVRPAEPDPQLSPLVGHAIYRVVQEAMTNAAKYAPGAAVRVRIDHRDGETEVAVVNDPPPAGPLPGAVPGNRGLIGLRERVLLLGGTLRSGPHGDGYELVAVGPDSPGMRRAAEPAADDASGSVRELARARRRSRRWFVLAFAAPVVLGANVVLAAVYLAYQLVTCVLPPADFALLRPGQSRSDVDHLLPAQQYRYVPQYLRDQSGPPGTVCEFYRSNGNVLDEVDIYRLCFAGSRLVAKDTLAAGGG